MLKNKYKKWYHYALDITALLVVIALFVHLCIVYKGLPDLIPTRFKLNGEVASSSKKIVLFVIPFIGLLINVGIILYVQVHKNWNLPVKVTINNNDFIHKMLISMFGTLEIFFSSILYTIFMFTIQLKALPSWYIMVIIGGIVLILAIYFTIICLVGRKLNESNDNSEN